MAFIPFAATVGGWLGGSAALGGTAIAATTIATAATISGMSAQTKALKRQTQLQQSLLGGPDAKALPEQKEEQAADIAKKSQASRRRAALRGGAMVDITGGTAILQPSQTMAPTLLGQ